MTSKLTAKLSDGTEWEVLSTAGPTCGMRSGVPYRDETIRVELKPIKPSPPKEVYVSYGAGRVWNVEEHDFSNAGGYPAHRYVLAEEPKEKDPAGVLRNTCTQCGREFRFLGVYPTYVRDVCGGCLGGKEKKQPREWWGVRSKNTGYLCSFFLTEEAAQFYFDQHFLGGSYEIVHVREVHL